MHSPYKGSGMPTCNVEGTLFWNTGIILTGCINTIIS